ncbi:MAG: DMT family transporter [Pseudomonadota bacterium]
MTTPQMTGRAWAELLLLALFWGGSFFSIAIALREMGPVTAVLHRVGWAAIVLWLIVWARGIPVPRSAALWGAFLMMGILNNVLPFTLMSWGQTRIESGLVSIFNAMTAPLGVLVAAMLLRDEPLSINRLAGVAIAFVGAAVVIGIDRLGSLDPRAIGQWAVLAGCLSYAFAGVWGKLHLRSVHPMVAAAGMLTGSSVVMIPTTLVMEGVPTLSLSGEVWAAIAYYALFATACAYLLYYRVLAMAGAGNLLLCTLVIPPIAVFLGWAFLAESLPATAFWGFGLIAVGLAVIDGRVLRQVRI